jgi:hypothetical protein
MSNYIGGEHRQYLSNPHEQFKRDIASTARNINEKQSFCSMCEKESG